MSGATPTPGAPSAMKKSIPWKIIGPILGAAAIGGVAVGLRGDKATTPGAAANPVSISAGAVTVGVPR